MPKTDKKPVWRIIVFWLSVAVIMLMWVYKGMTGTLSGMSLADALPMIAVSFVVTLVKVAVMAGILLLVKWVVSKIKK